MPPCDMASVPPGAGPCGRVLVHGFPFMLHVALRDIEVGCCDFKPNGGQGESLVPPFTRGSVSVLKLKPMLEAPVFCA